MIKIKSTRAIPMLALSLSLGICAGIFYPSFASPPPGANVSAMESQFQKLLLETKKNLSLYEKEREEHKSGPKDLYSVCNKNLDKAQEMALKLGGAGSQNKNTRLADVLMLHGNFLELSGNINPEKYEKALEIRETVFGPDHVLTAESLNKLAYIYVRSGQISNGADLLDRSIKIMEHNKGAGANDLAEALNKCMQRGMQRALEAKRITKRAARSIKKYAGTNTQAVATSLHALSKCEGERPILFGQEKAPTTEEDKALSQALALQEKNGGASLKMAELLETQAKKEDQKGQYPEAAKTYARVVAMREKLAPTNFSLLTRTYEAHACYLLNARNFPQAEVFKKKSLALYEKNPGPDDMALTTALKNMASFYKANNKLKECAACHERILKLKQWHESHTAETMDELAKVQFQMKDYPGAEHTLEALLAYYQKSAKGQFYDDDYNARRNILTLALAKTRLGKLDAAGKYIYRVKSSYERDTKSHNFYFGEKYPKDFMLAYIEYLDKAGKTAEALAMKTRLDAVIKKEVAACLGCGRG